MSLLQKWTIQLKPTLISKFFMEFLGTAMFHFMGSVTGTAFGNGLALMVLVYYTAKTSNAHLNPALSLTFTLLGYTNPLELLVYWIAQISGATQGALWLAVLVPGLYVRRTIDRSISGNTYDGCFVPREDLNYRQVFGWEALCTFTFFVPIFTVVWYTLHKKGYGNTGPIIIGLSLMINALVALPFTGAALNPARVLGSMIVFDCPSRIYAFYYIMGQLVAATIVPLVVIPWYGISPTAWYMEWIPIRLKRQMMAYQEKVDMALEA